MTQPREIHGAASVTVHSNVVKASVTLTGAHVAPVVFADAGRSAEPYSLAPWTPGEISGIDPLLDVLRGDFFCLPFGAQPDGPAHGEPASGNWTVTRGLARNCCNVARFASSRLPAANPARSSPRTMRGMKIRGARRTISTRTGTPRRKSL